MGHLHEWELSYAEAREVQSRLAGRVRFSAFTRRPRRVAGLDCAFSRDGKRVYAAAVVLRVVGMREEMGGFAFEHVETVTAEQETRFPYVPGLLSFREAPVCLEAVGRLSEMPDLFLIDGQGIAHPRRLGLAAVVTSSGVGAAGPILPGPPGPRLSARESCR